MRLYKDGHVSFSNEEQVCIIHNCTKYHLSIPKILAQYGLPNIKKYRDTILQIFERFNYDYKQYGNLNHQKYFFNEKYFDCINENEKAYWLGFLYADGYILKCGKTFGCRLKQRDENHLKKFLDAIKIENNPLSHSDLNNSCGFNLTSKHLVDTLKQYGFTNNKSYDQTDKPFYSCPDQYKKYFILGLWDGDGYVSKTKENKNITGVISNNKSLLIAISSYINNEMGSCFCKVTESDGYTRIRLYSTKAKKFLDWVYDGASVYLERKYEKYKQFNENYYDKYPYHNIKKEPSGRYYTRIIIDKKIITLGTFDTVKEAVDAYNNAAEEYGKPKQKYIGEIITQKEYEEYKNTQEKINE